MTIVICMMMLLSGIAILLAVRRSRRGIPQHWEIQVRETLLNVGFGTVLWLEALLLCICMAGSLFSGYPSAFRQNILFFLAAAILLGGFAFLSYFAKAAYVYPDRIVCVGLTGRASEIPWTQVEHIKILSPQSIRLLYPGDKSVMVSGERRAMAAFVDCAIRYLPEHVDKKPLAALQTRAKRRV